MEYEQSRLLLMFQVTRRAWAKNENAEETIKRAMEQDPKLKITLPFHTQNTTLENAFKQFQS